MDQAEKLFELFDCCIELAEHGPRETQATFINLAERILACTDAAIRASYDASDPPRQNAPTTYGVQ